MEQRDLRFDIMRVIACIMIICMHAPMPSEKVNSLFTSSVSYFTAPGLCLFFVISGALILPVKTDTKAFLQKRFGKVLMPTVCFSFVYLILNVIDGVDVNWVKSICSMPFAAQGHGVLWFMYSLIGLYLVAPIISRWLERANKSEVEFYLVLWAVSLCYPILKLVLDINQSETGVLYYFSGYLGYFVLGYYITKYPCSLTLKRLVLPIAISVLAPVVCKTMHVVVDFYSLFWYLSVFVAVLCTAIFVSISKICETISLGNKLKNVIVTTSNLSFGIYLIHIIIMRSFLWKFDFIISIENYMLQWAVIVVFTFVISWLVVYLLSILPFGDYIIGYKKKK